MTTNPTPRKIERKNRPTKCEKLLCLCRCHLSELVRPRVQPLKELAQFKKVCIGQVIFRGLYLFVPGSRDHRLLVPEIVINVFNNILIQTIKLPWRLSQPFLNRYHIITSFLIVSAMQQQEQPIEKHPRLFERFLFQDPCFWRRLKALVQACLEHISRCLQNFHFQRRSWDHVLRPRVGNVDRRSRY